MKLRSSSPSDSLDLLLDTMCNTLGGIVLIACLVALQVSDQPASPLTPAVEATSQLWERRLGAAQADIAALKKALETHGTGPTEATADMAMEIKRLRETLDALQKESDRLNTMIANLARDKARDPGAALEPLLAEEKAMQKALQVIENSSAAQKGQLAHLLQRHDELKRKLDGLEQHESRTLRLPKERSQTKDSLPFIIKYGRVYPLVVPWQKDNPHVRRTKEDDASKVEPLPSMGWQMSVDQATFSRVLRHFSSRTTYITVYVYPDSFGAFAEVRDAILKAGFDYGMDITQAGESLYFGEEGSSPPPQ